MFMISTPIFFQYNDNTCKSMFSCQELEIWHILSDLYIKLAQSESEMQHAKNLFKFARYDNSYTVFILGVDQYELA